MNPKSPKLHRLCWYTDITLSLLSCTQVADGSKKTIGVLGEKTGKAAETVAAVVTGAVGTTKHQVRCGCR